jgi:hypothetical protein
MTDDREKKWQLFASEYQAPCEAALINDLAMRCFRDTGDGDYIAARLALRAGLASQAIWSGLQAIEKYLKCMLLLRRISSKGIGHDIVRARYLVRDNLGYDFAFGQNEEALFKHLAESGGDRYLVVSLHLFHHELAALDSLVWRLRQFCDVLDVDHYNDPPSGEVLARNLDLIAGKLCGSPSGGYLKYGRLEQILVNGSSPAHDGLVWRNAMFGGNQPFDSESGDFNYTASNAPLYNNPQIVSAVSKLVHLPKGALEAYIKLAGLMGRA